MKVASPASSDVLIAQAGERARTLFPTYLGSKAGAGAAEQIIGHFPPHSVYVEAFLGGGAVLRRKAPALHSIAIDIDPEVVTRWRCVCWPGLDLVEGDAIAW